MRQNTNPLSKRKKRTQNIRTTPELQLGSFTWGRLHLLAGIHDVPRRAFVNTFVVVDNVTPRLPGVFAFVVQLLAEAEGHAAPALKVIVTGRAGVHASAIKVEVAARHAFLGVVGLRAVPQAFAVTALAIGGAALRLAGSWTDCEEKR